MIVARGRRSGFTLLEMLLSVAIIGALAAVSLPLYNSFVARNDMAITQQQVAETLRRAQVYARGMKDDQAWSVHVQSSLVTLYRGTNWASRTVGYDEDIPMPSGITASGPSDVQFAKLTGLPTPTTATITLTPATGSARTVVVNAQGMVEY